MRFLFAFLCFSIGGISAFYAEPYASNNADVVTIVVTVITVFAGFLTAIITIIGDPTIIPEGSWRIAEGRRRSIEQRLSKHMMLFYLYLITIGLLFISVILKKALPDNSSWLFWIEFFYLWLGITSFLFTLALPTSLLKLQLGRWDAETQKRRKQVGIQDGDDSPKT